MPVSARVPDVLQTISQLPADDVYTPPYVANLVLDSLPGHVWTDCPEYRWLDPGAKSGVFLREAFRRLMDGLVSHFPSPRERREHILRNMVFGAATTMLNGEMCRRTLYQSSDATGERIQDKELKDLVVVFSDSSGNIPYVRTEHTLDRSGKACSICRAPSGLIRDNRESFAYSFIHGTYPPRGIEEMQFDVIIGNPPYQIGMEDSDGNRTANITPLYNLFVERAIEMNPRFVAMITPSRWFAGGKGLSNFRDAMISDRRLKSITDFPNPREAFPTVEIKGGVSYFLWDREWDGDCTFSSLRDGEVVSTDVRDLRKYGDVILRDSSAVEIVDRVLSSEHLKVTMKEMVSTRDPFGQSITTNFKHSREKTFKGAIPLVFNNRIGYLRPEQIERNLDWVDKWKVLIPVASDGVSRESASVLGEPIALAPGSACTQSYLIAGVFDSQIEARNCAIFLTTKFCRYLVLQKKITQHTRSAMFSFLPLLDFKSKWTDEKLFALFELTAEQIGIIDRAIGPRDWIDSLDSSVPKTHLPGGRKYKSSSEDLDAGLEE